MRKMGLDDRLSKFALVMSPASGQSAVRIFTPTKLGSPFSSNRGSFRAAATSLKTVAADRQAWRFKRCDDKAFIEKWVWWSARL